MYLVKYSESWSSSYPPMYLLHRRIYGDDFRVKAPTITGPCPLAPSLFPAAASLPASVPHCGPGSAAAVGRWAVAAAAGSGAGRQASGSHSGWQQQGGGAEDSQQRQQLARKQAGRQLDGRRRRVAAAADDRHTGCGGGPGGLAWRWAGGSGSSWCATHPFFAWMAHPYGPLPGALS